MPVRKVRRRRKSAPLEAEPRRPDEHEWDGSDPPRCTRCGRSCPIYAAIRDGAFDWGVGWRSDAERRLADDRLRCPADERDD